MPMPAAYMMQLQGEGGAMPGLLKLLPAETPLNAEFLEHLSEGDQSNLLGEQVYLLVRCCVGTAWAGRIAGMLLRDIPHSELLEVLGNGEDGSEKLKELIEAAYSVVASAEVRCMPPGTPVTFFVRMQLSPFASCTLTISSSSASAGCRNQAAVTCAHARRSLPASASAGCRYDAAPRLQFPRGGCTNPPG